MIDINLPMIEPKLALFQAQVGCVRVHTAALGKPSHGKTPVPIDRVDMASGMYKFTDSLNDPQMLRVTQVVGSFLECNPPLSITLSKLILSLIEPSSVFLDTSAES
jgi:acetylornithine deacetylase/succinyl-diaminopimelate desuccinylase-like protein